MKIRNGFVSNSSSSSFMCQVSGEIVSGMDAGLSDFEMSECAAGHVFFDQFRVEADDFVRVRDDTIAWCRTEAERYNVGHPRCRIKPRSDEHRENLATWYQESLVKAEKQIEWINNYDGSDIDEFLEEFAEANQVEYGDRYALPTSFCPICTLGHIRDKDILRFLLARLGVDRDQVADQLKRHSSLDDLNKTIRSFETSPDSLGTELLAGSPDPTPPGFNLEHS